MKKFASLYPLLNGVFHLIHIAVITFVMTGWMFAPLRLAHLVVILLTLGSWFVLGRWLGAGYCPISDWHWKIKKVLGDGMPNGTYIHQLLQNISRRELNSDTVDKAVVMGTVALAAISLGLNLTDWFSAAQ
jgi:hypothetical protein